MNINELHNFKLSDAIKFNKRLNPVLFRDEHLIPIVREQLLEIADDFMQHMGIDDLQVADILLVGSNAAYTYTPHSDIDLHLVVDLGKNRDNPIYKELFTSKKAIYNDKHEIKIKNYDVELYIQDIKDSQKTLGEYSVLKNKWIKFPSKSKANFDERATRQKFNKIVQLAELALRSDNLENLDAVLDTIKKYRKAGLDKHGEFGPENLAYKALRSQGIVQQLFDYRDKLHGQDLSMDEDYDPNGPPPGPEFKPTMPKGTVRVDVSDVYDWYKLGQHISNMKGLGKHDFGKGPPSTIISFGDEDTEHDYIRDLEATGLTTTDIDPAYHDKITGQKVDPTFNVDEETLEEKWTKKYKKSINCSSPKGFSQKAHCAARRARQAGRKTKSKSVSEGAIENKVTFKIKKGKSAFSIELLVDGKTAGIYQYSSTSNRHITEVYPEFQGKGYGKLLVLKALETANKLGMDFVEDESRTQAYDNVIDSLESNGYIVRDDEYLYLTRNGLQYLNSQLNEGASGYIPSNAEKDDPRFKTALTVDVKPDTLKKNAKALGFKISRAGIPPLLRK